MNKDAVVFLQNMNEGLVNRHSGILLAAEDSTVYPGVTKRVAEGGLGFTYKWDMGFMHDTLEYFQKDTGERLNNRNKLTFSMHYLKMSGICWHFRMMRSCMARRQLFRK